MISRLDPHDCGCTDCMLGEYSKPLNKATPYELLLAANGTGAIENASGRTLTIKTTVEIS